MVVIAGSSATGDFSSEYIPTAAGAALNAVPHLRMATHILGRTDIND